MKKLTIGLYCLLPLTLLFAASTTNINDEVRILRNQIEYLGKQNLPKKINELEQSIGQLENKIEELTHTINTLQKNSSIKKSLDSPKEPKEKTIHNSKLTKNILSSNKSDADDQTLYHQAISAMKNSNRKEAAQNLDLLIKNHPKSKWVSHAHYWLGEINLQKNQIDEASRQFNIVINQYQKSPKHVDAMIKQAALYTQQDKIQQAIRLLERIIKEYPESNAANHARSALKKLK